MDVLGSTRGPTTVKKLTVNDLQFILTHSFITIDGFAPVITYLLSILFFHENYYYLFHQVNAIMPVIHVNAL